MAVSKMVKIRVIGLKKEKNKILDFLQKKGSLEVVEIVDNDQEKMLKAKKEEVVFDFAGVKFALNFLAGFSSEKISLKDKIRGKRIDIKESDFSNFLSLYPYQTVVAQVQEIQAGINESLSKINETKEAISTLSPWTALGHAPIKETEKTKIVFVIVPEKKYKTLEKELSKFKLFNIKIVNKIDKNLFLEIIFDKNEKTIDSLFEQLGLEKKELPFSDFSPEEAILKLKLETKDWERKKEELTIRAGQLSKEVNNLKIVFDILNAEKSKGDVKEKIGETEKAFVLTGWIEENGLKNIFDEIKKISTIVAIEQLEIKEDEERPVVIRNSHFWKPFETVTGIYGLPRHYEIDPTPILAPFFILFFALCLTDAIYGVVLMFLSFFAIKILKTPKPTHNLFRLLGYGGFVTFIVGALFGGWAGIDINYLPPIIRNLQLVNPIENPILVLLISLAIGVIQIIAGLMVAFYWKVKSGQIKEAIFNNAFWVAFLVSICLYLGLSIGIISSYYANLIMTLFWLTLLSVVYAGSRKQKNPLMKIVAGVGGLYGLIGYLADVLSYSRLLALGLATGIIAMVVNLIAGIASQSVPYFGIVLAGIILIIGHSFNIVINTLGSFIHSGRLQFVEFFPKFMDGGGRRFLPLRRDLAYINIIDEQS